MEEAKQGCRLITLIQKIIRYMNAILETAPRIGFLVLIEGLLSQEANDACYVVLRAILNLCLALFSI